MLEAILLAVVWAYIAVKLCHWWINRETDREITEIRQRIEQTRRQAGLNKN